MNRILEWFSNLFTAWKFWIVVPPWDVGVRIRLGKVAKTLAPGPHLRIPMLDVIVLVNTRLRIDSTPAVTVGGRRPGYARVMAAVVGYKIVDPVRSLENYAYPGPAISSFMQAKMSAQVSANDCLELARREFTDRGIQIEFISYIENVEARAYRLLSSAERIYGSPSPAGDGTLKTWEI
jgi:hypothetical protein